MKVAVIIPFRGDPALLVWTLEGYAQQSLGDGVQLEVRVGGDGCVLPPLPLNGNIHFIGQQFERMGAAAVRNQLLMSELPDLIIFGNADARPDAAMVQRHVERMAALPTGSLILGAAPWEMPEYPTVFDALIAQTPMIFFYEGMGPQTWQDYRHAWTLNLSVRGEDFARITGFAPQLRPVYYEDLAFAFDLMGSERKGVFYDPAAKVLHRHPMTLEGYLNREELLGLMAPVLAQVKPKVFAALFGDQSVAQLETEYRQWIKLDSAGHQHIWSRLVEWEKQPASTLGDGSARQRTLGTIYQMHIPLKRLAFRLGFLRGLELRDDALWQQRVPQGLWKQHLA